MVDLGARPGAAGGECDDDTFAGEQADGALLGILEGQADAGDEVDPGLEGGGDREVVDRQADDCLLYTSPSPRDS